MKTNGFVIGIDPDVEKSGVAVLDCEKREFTRVVAMSFPELVDYLSVVPADIQAEGYKVTLVLEDSDVSTNWHCSYKDNKATAAAKGRSVGMCHATARHIKEIAEHYGLEVVLQKPLRKVWKGSDGKITHEEAAYFMRGLPKSTNPETRDAALLAWNYAEYPIRVKS